MSSLYAVSPVVDISESTPQDLTQSEEIREFFVDRGRKHGSALLLKSREDYNARRRDADGRVLSTVSKGPTRDMTTETHNVHNNHVLTQKEQELVDFHKPGRANIGATLSSAKNSYALRPRTMSGLHVQTTVGKAPFSWAKERAEQRALERPQAPPTDYEARGALGPSTIGLRKLEKDRRLQLSSHLEDESEKYKFRMKIRQNIIDRKLSHSADRGGQRFRSEPIGIATSPMTANAIREKSPGSKSSQSRGQQQQRGRTSARTPRSGQAKREVRAASAGAVRGTSLDRHAAAAQRRQEQREQKQQQWGQQQQVKRQQVKQPRQPSPHSSFSSQMSTVSNDSETPGKANLSSLRRTSESNRSRSKASRAAGRIQGAISSAFGSPKSMDAGSHWGDYSPTSALESEEEEAGVVLSPYFGAYAHTEERTPTAKAPKSKAPLQSSSAKGPGSKATNSSPTSVSSTGSRTKKSSSSSSGSRTDSITAGHRATKNSAEEKPSRGRSTGRSSASALRAEVVTSGMKRPVVRRPIKPAESEEGRQNESSPRRSRSANSQRSRHFPVQTKPKQQSMTP